MAGEGGSRERGELGGEQEVGEVERGEGAGRAGGWESRGLGEGGEQGAGRAGGGGESRGRGGREHLHQCTWPLCP